MRKLTGKEYRKREKTLMKGIGVKPQPFSGAHWLKKEDGEGDSTLVQLKSTQASSITLKMVDLQQLFDHAQGVGKIPIFMLDFVEYKTQLICLRVKDIHKLEQIMRGEQLDAEDITLDDLKNIQ
jgi:hypothetical protein